MANNIIKRIWNQNTLVNIEVLKGAFFQDEDGGHTFEISGVDNSGNAISLSGTVAGVFLRPDNTDVPITGSASGGIVSVTLPAECYDVPGRFGLTVFVTADSKKTCIYAAIGTVGRTSSGSVAPGTSADVVDLINQISAAVATIPASWSGLMADIAPTYSTSAAYPVGAYVYYNGDLYRCTTAITTGETWTAAHWTTAVLGNDVSDLKTALGFHNVNFLENVEWEVGSIAYINGKTGQNKDDSTRIRTVGFINLLDIDVINFGIEPGYKYGIHLYETNVLGVASIYDSPDWVTNSETLIISETAPTAKYLRLNMADSSDSTANVSWAQYVTATHEEETTIDELENRTSAVEEKTEQLGDAIEAIVNLESVDILSGTTWEIGSIGYNGGKNGQNITGSTRIRTAGFIDINGIDTIKFNIAPGYKYGIHLYETNSLSVASIYDSPAFVTDDTTISIPIIASTAKYLRINMANASDSEGDIAWGNNLTANPLYPLTRILDSGVGSNTYDGEKINLTLPKTVFDCDISLWKNFESERATYELQKNQSLAVYGGYVFIFKDGGDVAIADYSTKSIIDNLTLPVTTKNHNNSAQFSDIYYQSGDEFPLIFTSRCGNTVGDGTGLDTCLIYRITRSGTDFTFTLVNTIQTDFTTYGNSWCINNSTHRLSMVGYVNNWYTQTTNNPIKFFTWETPSSADILSGNTITLTADMCVAKSEIDFQLLQSACAFGELIFFGISTNGQWVYAMNVNKGMVTSKVQLPETLEIEGISIYNGKMYTSHRNSGTFKIYEIEF